MWGLLFFAELVFQCCVAVDLARRVRLTTFDASEGQLNDSFALQAMVSYASRTPSARMRGSV